MIKISMQIINLDKYVDLEDSHRFRSNRSEFGSMNQLLLFNLSNQKKVFVSVHFHFETFFFVFVGISRF